MFRGEDHYLTISSAFGEAIEDQRDPVTPMSPDLLAESYAAPAPLDERLNEAAREERQRACAPCCRIRFSRRMDRMPPRLDWCAATRNSCGNGSRIM
jgi:hypothetical protein